MEKIKSNKFLLAIISAIFFKISTTHISLLWKFTAYTTSYIHLKQNWVTIHYGVINSPLFQMTTKLIGPIGGFMEKKFGGKKTIICGGIIIFFSLLLLYFQQNIWIYYFLTVTLGIGIGSCKEICLKNLCLFKPNRKGFLLSCVSTFTTIFHGIFFYFSEKYINCDDYALSKGSENQFYPEYISMRYQNFVLFLIFSFIFSSFFSVFFYTEYTNQNGNFVNFQNSNSIDGIVIEKIEDNTKNNNINNNNNNDNNNNNEFNNINNGNNNINNISFNEYSSMISVLSTTNSDFDFGRKKIKQNEKKIEKQIKKPKLKTPKKKDINYKNNMKKILKSKKFLTLVIYTFLSPFVTHLTMSNFKNFRILMYSVSFNRFIASTIGLIKIIIAPIVGIIVDKIGSIYILRILCIIRILIGILMSLFLDNPQFLFILALLCEVTSVGQRFSFTPYLYNIFTLEYSIEVLGIFGLGDGLSNLFSAIMLLFINYVSHTKKFDKLILYYRGLYFVGTLFSIIAFVLLWFENEEKFDYEGIKHKEYNKINIVE